MDDATVFAWIVVLAIAYFVIRREIRKNKTAKANESLFSFEKGDDVLTLFKRDPMIRNSFKVEQHTSYGFSMVPDKQVFTAVTVGGVTTGGVSTIKGGIQATPMGRTGEYFLWYKYCRKVNGNWEGAIVHSIELTPELLELAKNDPALKLHLATDEDVRKNYTQKVKKNALLVNRLSKEACNYILTWMCNGEKKAPKVEVNDPISRYMKSGGLVGIAVKGAKKAMGSASADDSTACCVVCGTPLKPGDKFCEHCGTPI